ncbi:ovochymase-2 isoform X1 [Pelobates cultripes]|uniref:Ovochymase-2 n=1 Tax=Pelobates cultripes TaxID=61616 RepID=A0AAD1WW84_PELCU|nr:ovochymase-2 isoform X1 [Pelobates cultripes]
MPGRSTSVRLMLLTLAVMSSVENGGMTLTSQSRASRCGKVLLASDIVNLNMLSRIVGGRPSGKGQHPWTVSLKRKANHFCGGTIVTSTQIITAAHCVTDRNAVTYIEVYVGDQDFTVTEPAQKIFSLKSIKSHPQFNPGKPINFDIAILELNGQITFDDKIQPACLPTPDEAFRPGLLCVALGWGRLQESGRIPSILYEVSLPVIEPTTCTAVMTTLKGSLKFETILCAGFPDGGKDACQGDSGGPLVCQRSQGSWVLAGVTSWGMGCGRKWKNNASMKVGKRGSPGIFTDLRKVLRWVLVNLNQDTADAIRSEDSCSMKDGILNGNEGELIFPEEPQTHYTNNELCEWTLKVPTGMMILLNFSRFDLESDVACNLDYLAIYSEEGQLIGKYCGDILPRPILISYNIITLKFFSDFQQYGTGFALNYSAVERNTYQDSECGSLAVHFEEGEIQSMNYPNKYASFANCYWVIHAPKYLNIKLSFEDFEVEASTNCSYDNVKVYQDLDAEDEIGVFCGFSIPPSVTSSDNIMHIKFTTDATENYKGFRASFSFVTSSSELFLLEIAAQPMGAEYPGITPPIEQREERDHYKTCGTPATTPRFIYSKLVGAQEAMPNSWPWHVSLQYRAVHVCDGVILSEYWILTSASCVYDKKELPVMLLVVAGLHDLSHLENNQKHSVKQIFVHAEFNRKSMNYNIALLQVREPFQFNSFIRPICLPNKDTEAKASMLCVVSGWGLQGKGVLKATKLQQLEVPILLNDICKAYYASHPGGITDQMFCAGFPAGNRNDTCTDRSGGPLVCLMDNKRYFSVFGIVNWGVNCRENPNPGVYTKVFLFIDWIGQIINGSATESNKTIGVQIVRVLVQSRDPSSNVSKPSEDVYFVAGCEDVVLLQPGDIKLDTNGQAYPSGFSCQWRIIAPKDQVIKLDLKLLHMPTESKKKCCNSLVVYDGISNGKILKAQLTDDMVPCTVWSESSAVTVAISTSSGNPQLQLLLVYSFHSKE